MYTNPPTQETLQSNIHTVYCKGREKNLVLGHAVRRRKGFFGHENLYLIQYENPILSPNTEEEIPHRGRIHLKTIS